MKMLAGLAHGRCPGIGPSLFLGPLAGPMRGEKRASLRQAQGTEPSLLAGCPHSFLHLTKGASARPRAGIKVVISRT